MLLALAATGATALAGDRLQQLDLARMRDPSQAEAEVGRLVLDSASDPGSRKLLAAWRFHKAPQPGGNPLHLLLSRSDYEFESRGWNRGYEIDEPEALFGDRATTGQGTAGKPTLAPVIDHLFQIFDDKGREVRPFGGNNFITYGYVFDLNSDGILERADTGYHSEPVSDTLARVLTVRTIETKPRQLLRVILHSIAEHWTDDYDPQTCLNLVEFLLDSAWIDQLGDRWNTTPPIEHRNLSTPTEERLKPRADSTARAHLAAQTREAFAIHKRDPLPPSLLLDLVRLAGEEALADLSAPIRELAGSLPAPNAEDREFERPARKFAGDHFGPALNRENESDLKAWARYEELREKRAYQPGPVLRDAVAHAIRQLQSTERPDLLMAWARGNEHGNGWALQQLERHYPAAHADILRDLFEDANEDGRHRFFETIAAANPKAALELRDSLSPAEIDLLLLNIVQLELESDPAGLPKRAGALFKIVETPQLDDPWRRGSAMTLLSRLPLNDAQRERLDRALLAEFRSEAIHSPRSGHPLLPFPTCHRGRDPARTSRPGPALGPLSRCRKDDHPLPSLRCHP